MGNAWCDVHRVDEAEALLDAALSYEVFDGVRDVYEAPAGGHLEPQVLSQ